MKKKGHRRSNYAILMSSNRLFTKSRVLGSFLFDCSCYSSAGLLFSKSRSNFASSVNVIRSSPNIVRIPKEWGRYCFHSCLFTPGRAYPEGGGRVPTLDKGLPILDEGVPTFDRGYLPWMGGTYLGWGYWMWVPTMDRVPTLDGLAPTLDGAYLLWTEVYLSWTGQPR